MANYLGLVNGLPNFTDGPRAEEPSPVRQGLDIFTAGNGLFPTNLFDVYGDFASPLDLNHSINRNDNTDSVSASDDNLRNQSQLIENPTDQISFLPSFPSTFGTQAAAAPATYSLPSPFSTVLPPFVPRYPDFFDAASFTTPSLPNSVGAIFGDIGPTDPPQMPDRNQGGHQHSGESFINDSFAGASACPFAPLRQNNNRTNGNSFNSPHHHYNVHNYNPNPNLSSRHSSASLPQPPISTSARAGCQHREPNSDDYLSALIYGDFSSPSLPPLHSSPLASPSANPESRHLPPPQPLEISNNMPRLPSAPTAASRRGRRLSRPSIVDLSSPKTERHSTSPSGVDFNTPRAPPNRKRSYAAATTTSSQVSAQQNHGSSAARPNPIKPLKSSRQTNSQEDALPFDSSSVSGNEEEEILDLTGADMPEELLKTKVDNRVKLTKFQCVICMDDVSNLTVTHCGHLFCSECLHSALHIDSSKKTCPVCRTKVETKAKPGLKQSKNTFYHLELQLMTANRKGKRPIGR